MSSVDLVIVGAIIKETGYLRKAIRSAPNFAYGEIYILLDGCPENKSGIETEKYLEYKEQIKELFPYVCIIEYDVNIYFREMIKDICEKSESDRILVIQDDVILDKMNLQQISEDFDELDHCKIISFPHKNVEDGNHWYIPIKNMGQYLKCHGWSERAFIFDRLDMKVNLQRKVKGERQKKFIEQEYQNRMKSKSLTLEYWATWGCYTHNKIFHTHLVGHR